MRVLASNKKAYFNFEIIDSVEAGIVLLGWEVKSVKQSRVNLAGAYIKVKDNELFLNGAHISNYKFSFNKGDEERERKILLHRKQILELINASKQDGVTIVPLEVVENNKKIIKVVVALVRGRKKYDKRQKLKEQDIKRRIDQDRKRYNI